MVRLVWMARLVLVLAILACYFYWKERPDGQLHVVFCNVEQGDGTIIIKDDWQILIDAGPPNGKMLACLGKHLPFWDRKIEVFLPSHDQLDHVGGIEGVLTHYSVEQVFSGRSVKAFEQGKQIARGDVLVYGNIHIEILNPIKEVSTEEDLNEAAVVAQVRYGDLEVLFTGDIGKLTEKELMKEGMVEKVEVLKVAHHGSRYSSDAEFVRSASPKLAVISVGGRNNYGHPAAETIEILEKEGTRIWRTDRQGELELVSDGTSFWLK